MKYTVKEWGRKMIFSPIENGKLRFDKGDVITLFEVHADHDENSTRQALEVFFEIEIISDFGSDAFKIVRVKDLESEIFPYLREHSKSYYEHLTKPSKKLDENSFLYQELTKLEKLNS